MRDERDLEAARIDDSDRQADAVDADGAFLRDIAQHGRGRIEHDARAQRWTFDAPAAVLRYVAQKGSICVDGVSLTVNGVDAGGFDVALIPHTLAHTAFASTQAGDAVNLEVDLVARYVERLLTTRDLA